MKNPNAFVALLAGGFTFGVQALLRHYGYSLDQASSQALDVGVTTTILWIGREGLKGAFSRLWRGTKSGASGLWGGSKDETPAA